MKNFTKMIPLGRVGTANVIVFLTSDAASYVIGESIEVNRGQLMVQLLSDRLDVADNMNQLQRAAKKPEQLFANLWRAIACLRTRAVAAQGLRWF